MTVLEAAERPGGAVATEELTLPGFRHDVFSAVYPAGGRVARVRALAARAPRPALGASAPLLRAPARRTAAPRCSSRDLGETARRSTRCTRATAPPGGRSPARTWSTSAPGATLMLAGFPPVRGAARTLAAPRARGRAATCAQLLLMPAQRARRRGCSRTTASRAWLYGSAMHGDVPPDGPGSAIAAAHLNLMGHAVGWPSPEGGADRLAGALAGHLDVARRPRPHRRAGHARARRARPRGRRRGRGRGAGAGADRRRRRHPGRRCCGWRATRSPPRYARRARAPTAPGPATMKVDWALVGPDPVDRARGARGGHGPRRRRRRELLDALAPAAACPSARSCCSASSRSPTRRRAPAGRHTAWAYTHGPHEADWARETEHVERIEAQVERFAPGFRDRILARHVLAPADLERRDANLVGGDVGGGSYALDQVVFRPRAQPVAVPHAGARALPRQRRDVPRRRRARRPGPRRGAAALRERRLRAPTAAAAPRG